MIEPDTSSPIGTFHKVWMGYSTDESIRREAASGGIVSSMFIHLLETGQIDAALVCHSQMKDGALDHKIYLAKTREEILAAQTSKYFNIPILKGIKLIEEFDGKVAVVGLPSQINAITRRIDKNEDLAQKIVFKISLFCGHNSEDDLVKTVWKKKGIQESEIDHFYFRKGLWRGRMRVHMKDGTQHEFPFQDFSHYQNLHILSLGRCLNCFDHMGYYADISTGDVWTRSAKEIGIKPSIFLARTDRGLEVAEEMLKAQKIEADETDREALYRSQMRSINYHYAISARAKVAKYFGLNIKDRTGEKPKFRDVMAACIVLWNHKISGSPKALSMFMKIPKPILAIYVYIFKGLTHYKRKSY